MTEEHSIAKQYRDLVRDVFKFWGRWTETPAGDVSDRAFYDFLEREYDESKEFLAYLLGEKMSVAKTNKVAARYEQYSWKPAERGDRQYLYEIAAGLFTYGRLDVVDDMLDNRLKGIGQVAKLLYSLSTLTPLPKHLGPKYYLKDWPEADTLKLIREWFEANQSKLRWNEAKERYEWIEPSEGRNR